MKGKLLSKEWGVNVKHALYRESGDWYHQLRHFPGAFFDKQGYIVFNTELEYKSCPYIQIQKDVHIPNGISSIPGYTRVIDDNKKIEQKFSVSESDNYYEGSQYEVTLSRYERNREARRKCIEHHGTSCSICKMNFVEEYGDFAEGIIHVHHITPIHLIGEEYKIDPISDLIPVCPNCHAVIHKSKTVLKIEEVIAMRNKACARPRH